MVKEHIMKHTEIGLLPKDWNVINLEKNFTIKARIGWQGLTTAEYLDGGNYGLVTGTDFKNGYIDWDNCVFVEKIRFDQDRNIQLKNDDVLVTKDGTIGKIAYIDFLPTPTTLNSGVFVIRPKSKEINNRFFYYVLMSFYFDDFLLKITAGSTITHLYQKDFVNFNFVCPPLPEQEAIAEALSDADAWIESLEQLIAKKRLIKQGAMQELLTPKEGWEVKKLGEVLKFGSGRDYKHLSSGDIPVYGTGGVLTFVDNYLYDGISVGIGRKGTIDKPVLLVGKFWTVDTLFFTHSFLGVNPIYIYYQFLLIPWREYNEASGVPSLNKNTLEQIEIIIPSFNEQTRIATILSDMDAELEVLEAQLAKARQIKQGMMQELLTGRVRLI
ncbi:restriction endonuclease subunit S [Chryseobacterium sp. Mn2064]|uniref:restriction endonuclease subunit S n=1 Tax=Chryseobacterium sp. Mn2064 TaxID=3395263 RepID=UPI003BC4D405